LLYSMKLNRLALFPVILAGAACASSQLPTEPVVYSQAEAADSVLIRVAQTIVVEGVRVRFNAVESDSRCASDVVCVWEGDAVADFSVEQNCECESPTYTLQLHTTLEPKSGVAYGYRVELRRLEPYPIASSPIRKDAYSAWIRVVRAE
jgi:hypothetical protein